MTPLGAAGVRSHNGTCLGCSYRVAVGCTGNPTHGQKTHTWIALPTSSLLNSARVLQTRTIQPRLSISLMSLKQEAEREGDNKLARLVRNDEGIRRAAKFFWQQSRRDSEVFPFPYLLLASVRLEALSLQLSKLVNETIYLCKLRESDAYGPSTVQQEIQEWKAQPLIQAHLDDIHDDPADSSLMEDDSLLREVEDQISRDAALSITWWSSVRVSWRSALVNIDMPPFRPAQARNEEVKYIADEARKTDFWSTATDLGTTIEKADPTPLLPIAKLLARHYREYFRKLKEEHPRQASSEREKWIRYAERSKLELQKQGRRMLETFVDRHNARVLSGLYDEFSLGSRALSKFLSTNFGSDTALDTNIEEKQEIRSLLRKNMERTLLSLGCFVDTIEALNDKGDPKYARQRIASETDRRATRDQAEHLETAYRALKANPDLIHASKDKLKHSLGEETTGGNVIRSVERLAKNKCFEVKQKTDLPDHYRGYKSGGFANLVRDLFHGSWSD